VVVVRASIAAVGDVRFVELAMVRPSDDELTIDDSNDGDQGLQVSDVSSESMDWLLFGILFAVVCCLLCCVALAFILVRRRNAATSRARDSDSSSSSSGDEGVFVTKLNNIELASLPSMLKKGDRTFSDGTLSDVGSSSMAGTDKTKDLNGYVDFVVPGEGTVRQSAGTLDGVDGGDYVLIPKSSAGDGTSHSNDQFSAADSTSAYVIVPGNTFSKGSFNTDASVPVVASDGYTELELVKPGGGGKKRATTATPPVLPNDPGDSLRRTDSFRRGAPSLSRPTRETYISLRTKSNIELKPPTTPRDPGEEAKRMETMSGAPPTPRTGPSEDTYGTLELSRTKMSKTEFKEVTEKRMELLGIDNSHYQQLPGIAAMPTMTTTEMQSGLAKKSSLGTLVLSEKNDKNESNESAANDSNSEYIRPGVIVAPPALRMAPQRDAPMLPPKHGVGSKGAQKEESESNERKSKRKSSRKSKSIK
jgi:hypothetical protein